MATTTRRAWSGPEHYAWTFFVALAVMVFLFGVYDLLVDSASIDRADTSLIEKVANMWSFNNGSPLEMLKLVSFTEAQGGLFGVLIAVFGLRRGERWAWYAMWLWPLFVSAEIWRLWSYGDPGAATTATGFLLLTLAAVALAYRRSFRTSTTS